jgi:hypothetical protein
VNSPMCGSMPKLRACLIVFATCDRGRKYNLA